MTTNLSSISTSQQTQTRAKILPPARPETPLRQADHCARRRAVFGGGIAATLLTLVAPVVLGVSQFAPASFAQDSGDDTAEGSSTTLYADDGSKQEERHARVRFLEGEMTIDRYEEESKEAATINAPIFAGDAASTPTGARAEIQLEGGAIVRLDERSRMTFLSLPEPGASDQQTVLQLSEGSVEVEVHKLRNRDADFRIDTASASVYILAGGRYRIDIEGKYGQARVSCYRGVAEVAGDEGSVMLRSGQRTFVAPGNNPESARAFNTAASDAFDGWIFDRDDTYLRAGNDEADNVDEAQIPEPIRPYQNELSYYGGWTSIPGYGQCWIPAGTYSGWRPYSNGYWSYGPAGSFWVSYDPWGWAPYHYGRWFWAPGFGWAWAPGSVFSGAWVSWYYGPSYIGWCPIDYWGYPCAMHAGIGIDYHCWNFVTYHNVYVRNPRKVYVSPFTVRTEVVRGAGVVVNRPVRISPHDLRNDQVTPALVVKQAREFGTTTPTQLRERATKRSFRETESEVLQARPTVRRDVRAGSAGRSTVSGAAGAATATGTVPVRPRGTQPDSPRRPDGGTQLGTNTPRPATGSRSRHQGNAVSGAPSHHSLTAEGEIQGADETPNRQGTVERPSSERKRPSTVEDLEPLLAPRRHPAAGATGTRSPSDQSDRKLREFFRESEPRPASPPAAESGTGGSGSRAGSGSTAKPGSSSGQAAGSAPAREHAATEHRAPADHKAQPSQAQPSSGHSGGTKSTDTPKHPRR